MENHLLFLGKLTICKWSFSIAMLVYRRVAGCDVLLFKTIPGSQHPLRLYLGKVK